MQDKQVFYNRSSDYCVCLRTCKVITKSGKPGDTINCFLVSQEIRGSVWAEEACAPSELQSVWAEEGCASSCSLSGTSEKGVWQTSYAAARSMGQACLLMLKCVFP